MKFLFNLPDQQYIWLKKHSKEIGESIATIIRRAINEYKEKFK